MTATDWGALLDAMETRAREARVLADAPSDVFVELMQGPVDALPIVLRAMPELEDIAGLPPEFIDRAAEAQAATHAAISVLEARMEALFEEIRRIGAHRRPDSDRRASTFDTHA
ncbi:MAG: hypothetical protein ACOYNI_00575 [Acidimicrobiia bacterium]